MKISYKWLKDYINLDLSPAETAEILTNTGLEVEEVERYCSLPGSLDKVVTGLVVEVKPHPDADRLKVTKVDTGDGEYLDIICGAPNVAEGQKVIVAKPGAILTNNKGEQLPIKKARIRGIKSEGMICAEDELGIGTDHSGIMILDESTPVGLPATDILKVYEDSIFEVAITPNRADAVSHTGVARDLSAALEIPLNLPYSELSGAATGDVNVSIRIEDPEKCPRYSGIVIKGLKVKSSPDWLVNRLESIGLQAINNVVDITNFVMYELGHPLHAFDIKEVKGDQIIIGNAKPGYEFLMLDGKKRKLTGTELMIFNAVEPLAMAGIMGGEDSGVHKDTTDIFIESACFDPATIRDAAKLHQISTDASFRFERGMDPNGTLTSLKRAASLILEVAGGHIASPVFDEYPNRRFPDTINLGFDYVRKITGVQVENDTINKVLRNLGYETAVEGNHLKVTVPTYRVDVTRPVDLVEEFIRIYGLNNIGFSPNIVSPSVIPGRDPLEGVKEKLTGYLSGSGFLEIMTSPFTSNETVEKFQKGGPKPVQVVNPLSQDQNHLRFSLLLSGLEAVRYNLHRNQENLKFFETGKEFFAEGENFNERELLTMFLTGSWFLENWKTAPSEVSFFHLKGMADNILRLSGIKAEYTREGGSEFFDYSLKITSGKKEIGEFGKVNSLILREFDIKDAVFAAAFNLESLSRISAKKLKVAPVPRFPSTSRDLSLLVSKGISFGLLKESILRVEKRLLKNVFVFDVYEGDKVKSGYRSYAIRMVFQDPDKTLNDKYIDKIMSGIIKELESKGAEVRK